MPAGRIERRDRRVQHVDHVDVPERDLPGDNERAEHERRDDRRALRDQEKPPALDAIGHGPANESEREDGRGAKQAAKAEKERRIGQLVEQPRRRGELDPGARHRDQLPDPIQRVVPMTERSEPREKCRHAIIADGTGECACA